MQTGLPTSAPSTAVPSALASAPTHVLAEGTAPVVVTYRAAPRARRSPWLAILVALVGTAALSAVLISRRSDERAFAARYPVAATADEARALADSSDRWNKARLLASLAHFDAPALATLKGTGDCTLSTAGALRYTVRSSDGRELARSAATDITALLANGRRARFLTEAAKRETTAQLAAALVVVHVTDERAPALDRARDAISPGALVGTAYAFDPATGRLACAGRLHVTAPTSPPLSTYAGLDAAQTAAADAFTVEVDRALAASLRSVD